MGILNKYQTIEIISEMRNIDKSDVILYYENKYSLCKLIIREEILMTPIFKCLICRKDIERSKKTFWKKKGHLLCSTCLDNIEKKQ